MYDEFTSRDTVVVALAQEDTDLETHGSTLKKLETPLPFEVVADLNREVTTAYDRTTAYLIDKRGRVRQIFPMMIHFRPSWKAILGEVEALEASESERAPR